jgi:hypothetical protein
MKPAATASRRIFECDRSYAGDVISSARRKRTSVFLSDAAEAKWCHTLLAKEWLLVQQQKNARWWENEETVPALMQIELKSHMNILFQRYGREW